MASGEMLSLEPHSK